MIGRRGRGLAITSVSVGTAGLTLALATWVAWLVIRTQLEGAGHYTSWVAQVFALVLGALWFALLPAGVLGIVFGLFAGARDPYGSGIARVGAYLCLLTLAVALAGAAVFALTPSAWSTQLPVVVGY